MIVDEFTLDVPRERLRLAFGGISSWHVLRESTFPANTSPGNWTRKAWDRRTLCGSLRACVAGGDAAKWAAEDEPIPLERITCKRCAASYASHLARAT